MIRWYVTQLLFAGSAAFAVLSFALPLPLLSSHQDKVNEHSLYQHATVQRTSFSNPPEDEVQILALTYPPTLHIGAEAQPEKQTSNTLSQPAIEKRAQESEQLKSIQEADKPGETKEQVGSFAEPILAMPSSMSVNVKADSAQEDIQLTHDVAPSLLAEESQPKSRDLDAAKIEEITVKKVETPPAKTPIIGVAQRIEVQSIGIDIAVRPGVYDPSTQSWTVDDDSAFHANTTVPVNDTNGTTLIYGHAKWGIFGTLPDLQQGAEAVVYSEDGLKFIYTFESVQQVDPSDVSMLTVEGKPRLLLQTCSGFFDQYRTLATFDLKEVAHG